MAESDLPREVAKFLLVGRIVERKERGATTRGVVKFVTSKYGTGLQHGGFSLPPGPSGPAPSAERGLGNAQAAAAPSETRTAPADPAAGRAAAGRGCKAHTPALPLRPCLLQRASSAGWTPILSTLWSGRARTGWRR
jgi:hypothetical protein